MTRGGEMTLEQATADWRDQIGKLTAERDDLREKLLVEEGLVREFHDHYTAQLMISEKLIAERDAWRKLVMEHNAMITENKRKIVWPDQKMWPEAYRIDIPPELEQP